LFGTGGRDPSEWVVAIVGMPIIGVGSRRRSAS
jgi:hypothetical protein